MKTKPKILISFREGGENGGPFVSHKRIMESNLNKEYEFIPLIVPEGRLGLLNLPVIMKLVKDIRDCKPDVIHYGGLQLEGFHVILAARIVGVENTVLAIHGSSLEATDFPNWKKAILNILEITTLKLSKVTYGVSDYVSNWKNVKKYSKNHYGTIYNMPFIDNLSELDASEKSFRKEIGAKRDDILIVSTGRITKEKGYDVLLSVIKKFSTLENIKFVIVGDGEYLKEYKEEVKNDKLTGKVFVLGYRKDVGRILRDCDIFITCTKHETLCNSLIEASFCSLPAVATDVGGIPEVIRQNTTGYLVPSHNIEESTKYLRCLIDDADLRKKMGAEARKHVTSKFSIKRIENQIDTLYKEVLA